MLKPTERSIFGVVLILTGIFLALVVLPFTQGWYGGTAPLAVLRAIHEAYMPVPLWGPLWALKGQLPYRWILAASLTMMFLGAVEETLLRRRGRP